MYGQFFLLFALIIVGYYCNKKGWLNRETNKNMSGMVMHVMIPAMLISTIASLQVNDRILKVFLLSMALPSAIVVPMMVEQYGYGEKLSSDIVLWTTFISMLTMPLCVWIAGILY